MGQQSQHINMQRIIKIKQILHAAALLLIIEQHKGQRSNHEPLGITAEGIGQGDAVGDTTEKEQAEQGVHHSQTDFMAAQKIECHA